MTRATDRVKLTNSQLIELAEYAKQSIELGSKSFAGAAKLFDPELRTSVQMLYAWCRYCDDVIDDQALGFQAPASAQGIEQRLATLRAQTERALRGEVDSPAFAALAYVMARHALPVRYPMELLDGFALDAEGSRFRTLDDTIVYSYHVAGVVGIMMAIVMGVREEAVLDRACDLGIAFQLTNIARDVIDDARIGRVYLPQMLLAKYAVTPERVLDPEVRGQLHSAVCELIEIADAYYQSAYIGMRFLPWRAACAIGAARRVYRQIGWQLVAGGSAAWDRRVVVSPLKKRALVAAGVVDASLTRLASNLPVSSRDGLWERPRANVGS